MCALGASSIDFQTATTGVASKAMKNELDKLANTIPDPATKKVQSKLSKANGVLTVGVRPLKQR